VNDEGDAWDWGPLQEALDAGVLAPVVAVLVQVMTCEAEPIRCRLRAVAALSRLAERARPALPDLVKAMASGDALLGAAAEKALERILGDPRRVPLAIMKSLLSADVRLRQAAAGLLGTIAGPVDQIVDVLTACLRDEDEAVIEAAARSLGHIGAPARSALPALEETLTNRLLGNVDRTCVALAVRRIREASGIDWLKPNRG